MKNKIIISLSTIPPRINYIEPVLDSLINQDLEPDLIYINVPVKYDRFDEEIVKPNFLLKDKFKDKVKLFYTDKDYGPATKFIGSLINNNIDKDDYVIITDDDVIKSNNWSKLLFDKFIDLKQTHICSFVEMNLGNKITWGYLGYIFKKRMLGLQDINNFYNKIKNSCFLVDDHWLTGYCLHNSIPVYNIPINRQYEINKSLNIGSSLVNLEGENHRRITSEKCRNLIKKEFNTEVPFWCCIGCCKKGKKIEVIENFEPEEEFDWPSYKYSFLSNDVKDLPSESIDNDKLPFDKVTLDQLEKMSLLKTKPKSYYIIDGILSISILVICYRIVYVLDVFSKFKLIDKINGKFLPVIDSLFKSLDSNESDLGSIHSIAKVLGFKSKKIIHFILQIILLVVLFKVLKYIFRKVNFVYKLRNESVGFNSLVNDMINPFNSNIESFSLEIPKVIIQTYHKKERIPQKVYDNIREYAPNYKHIVYDDEEIIEFLKNNFKDDVVKTFNNLKGAHKADLFRYCYLYKYGGIYMDIKTELIRPLSEIFNRNYTYSVLSIVRDTVYQGVIATPPGNPIFLKLIKFMIQLVKSGRKYNYIIFTKDLWNNIYRECNMRPFAGVNKNIENPKFNYLLFQEKCTKDKLDCYDGLDRHKLCCYICEGGERIIKSRYADFPW